MALIGLTACLVWTGEAWGLGCHGADRPEFGLEAWREFTDDPVSQVLPDSTTVELFRPTCPIDHPLTSGGTGLMSFDALASPVRLRDVGDSSPSVPVSGALGLPLLPPRPIERPPRTA
jgi:hypothetical protein